MKQSWTIVPGSERESSWSIVARLCQLLATAAVAPDFSWAQGGGGSRVALYASVGPTLTHYDVDVAGAELSRRDSVTLPANVQYAWPHASRQYLYVASSNSSPGLGGVVGDRHHVSAFRIDGSGALTPHGQPIPLPSRPIHLTTDMPSEYVLVAFNNPSALRVYRINRDATLGEEVQQPGPIDAGIFAHQVRVTDNNRLAILVTRGNDRAGEKPEDPGALKVFNFRNGRLTNAVSVAPNGGYGFGPRHLDFHPSQPWVYVSLERENKLDMFTLDGDTLSIVPRFRKETLARPTISCHGRQRVPCTCTRTAASCTGPIAPTPRRRSKARRSSSVGKTTSRPT